MSNSLLIWSMFGLYFVFFGNALEQLPRELKQAFCKRKYHLGKQLGVRLCSYSDRLLPNEICVGHA